MKRVTKSKASRRPPVKVLQDLIFKHYGIVTYIAEELNVTPMTLYKYINASPTLQQALKDSRERQVDTGVSKLMQNVNAGKETSIIFLLKCLGKQRGYIDKEIPDVQITNNNYKQINIVVQDKETQELLEGIVINQKLLGNPENDIRI
jgi:hypothetical protein